MQILGTPINARLLSFRPHLLSFCSPISNQAIPFEFSSPLPLALAACIRRGRCTTLLTVFLDPAFQFVTTSLSQPVRSLMNPRFAPAVSPSISGACFEGLSNWAGRCHVPNDEDVRACSHLISQSASKSMNLGFALSLSSSYSRCCLEGFSSSSRERNAFSNPAASVATRPPCFLRALFNSISLSTSKRYWTVVRGVVMGNKGRENGRIECSTSKGVGDQPVSPVLLPVTAAKGFKISFCPRCGSATEEKIPIGENEVRYVCTACHAVHYQNPKMVVGCLIEHEGKILLCRRNIEPAYGLWTLPAGYMEIGESAAEGAARETLEEACASVQVLGLFAHLDLPFIGQCRAT